MPNTQSSTDTGPGISDGVETLVDHATDDLGHRLKTAGGALQETSESRDDLLSRASSQVADRLESAGEALLEVEPRRLLDLTEDFARQRPALFLSAVAGLGFLIGRFFKAGDEGLRSTGRRRR